MHFHYFIFHLNQKILSPQKWFLKLQEITIGHLSMIICQCASLVYREQQCQARAETWRSKNSNSIIQNRKDLLAEWEENTSLDYKVCISIGQNISLWVIQLSILFLESMSRKRCLEIENGIIWKKGKEEWGRKGFHLYFLAQKRRRMQIFSYTLLFIPTKNYGKTIIL